MTQTNQPIAVNSSAGGAGGHVSVPPVAPWGYLDYQAAIQAKLEVDFEDVSSELEKLKEISRLDFDPEPWIAGSPPPGGANLMTYAFYESPMPGSVFAYVYPIDSTSPKSKLWRRYTFSLIGGVAKLEVMNRDVFVDELVEEIGAQLDPETCARCGKPTEEDDPEGEDPEVDPPAANG